MKLSVKRGVELCFWMVILWIMLILSEKLNKSGEFLYRHFQSLSYCAVLAQQRQKVTIHLCKTFIFEIEFKQF